MQSGTYFPCHCEEGKAKPRRGNLILIPEVPWYYDEIPTVTSRPRNDSDLYGAAVLVGDGFPVPKPTDYEFALTVAKSPHGTAGASRAPPPTN